MAGPVLIVLNALWLFLPAYFANMAPVFVGGFGPIDGGRNWKDGKRMLGDGKTWGGLLFAPLVAAALTVGLDALHATVPWLNENFPDFGDSILVVFLMGYAFGLGAIVGDAVKSFLKRRTGKDRGDPWIGFDQLDFVVGGFTFGLVFALVVQLTGLTDGNWVFERWTPARTAVVVVLTPGLHLLVNWIGYKIGRKQVPW